MRIVLASRNAKKVGELAAILAPLGHEVVPVSTYPDAPEVEETGATFEANAALKAETIRDALGLPALGDDSGLMVHALDGAPGLYSARFAGPDATDADNNALLLEKLAGRSAAERGATFVCVLAYAVPGRATQLFRGEAHGRILGTLDGAGGFGYDPLFYANDLGTSYARAPAKAKNRVSHRGHALAAFAEAMRAVR